MYQSVIIAGGYGTGREVVEFFLTYGPLGGLLGMMLITTIMWCLVLAVTFEFARIHKAQDYRTFFIHLLGSYWFTFEILYLVLLLLVLAIIGSTAGLLLMDAFNLPYFLGVALMLGAVGLLTFEGTSWIENFLSSWSVVLYFVYLIFFVQCLREFGGSIYSNLLTGIQSSDWFVGGFKYGLYNLGVIPAVLFTVRHIRSRRQAIAAGLAGGVIGILPAFLFYIAILGHYPAVLTEPVPAIYVLREGQWTFLLVAFQIVLLGTLVETGSGMIHAVNERLRSAFEERGRLFPRWLRPTVAVALLAIGLAISSFGLIELIAKGYGSISWGFLFVYVIPIMSIGLLRIWRKDDS